MKQLKNYSYDVKDIGENREHALVFLDVKGKQIKTSAPAEPNLALTVDLIEQKFTRGLPIPDAPPSGKPVWVPDMNHDSPDLGKIAQMDNMDKFDMARSAEVRMKPAPAPPSKPGQKDALQKKKSKVRPTKREDEERE